MHEVGPSCQTRNLSWFMSDPLCNAVANTTWTMKCEPCPDDEANSVHYSRWRIGDQPVLYVFPSQLS